ncbi:MAG: hypothetical protein AAGG08_06640 [Actinomycetota bacterium]
MGLFGRKKQQTVEELEALRSELSALRERLDATDAAKHRLEENIGGLHAENGRLRDELLLQISSATTASNDATRLLAEQTAAQLDEQRSRLADLAVVATDAAERAASAGHLDPETAARIAEAEQQVAEAVEQARRAAEQAEALGGRADGIEERIGLVDARLDQVTTELVNQLSELSDDLESRAAPSDLSPPPAPDAATLIDAEAIEELLDAQERLAAEQARYQIAFRQDLAELADRLRRER